MSDIRTPVKRFSLWAVIHTEERMSSSWLRIKVQPDCSTVTLMKDGIPDLNKVAAFVAMGNQGIVYEANRWHSPMCALDEVGPTIKRSPNSRS